MLLLLWSVNYRFLSQIAREQRIVATVPCWYSLCYHRVMDDDDHKTVLAQSWHEWPARDHTTTGAGVSHHSAALIRAADAAELWVTLAVTSTLLWSHHVTSISPAYHQTLMQVFTLCCWWHHTPTLTALSVPESEPGKSSPVVTAALAQALELWTLEADPAVMGWDTSHTN